jgi:hypothetical protein
MNRNRQASTNAANSDENRSGQAVCSLLLRVTRAPGRLLPLAIGSAGLVLGLAIWQPASAEPRFDCYSHVVPIDNAECEAAVVELIGSASFSCGAAQTSDQVIYCGAVWGYEAHWCATIADPRLRAQCVSDTE